MLKTNKKLILLLILLSILLTGCGKAPKAPDGFDKDLWNDSVGVIRVIHVTYESDNNFSVEDEDKIKEYLETYKGRLYDNKDEYTMIKSIKDLYESYGNYIFSKVTFSDKSRAEKDKEKFDQIFKTIQDRYDDIISN